MVTELTTCRRWWRIPDTATRWWIRQNPELWWVHFLDGKKETNTSMDSRSARSNLTARLSSVYLSWYCEGCSSWCRCRTDWTRTQTWTNPETQDKFEKAQSDHSQTYTTHARLTCMWQPAAMVVGIMVKLTASTWPTAEVWLARTLVGVTGPSWIKKHKDVELTTFSEVTRWHRCAKCSLCTSPWL